MSAGALPVIVVILLSLSGFETPGGEAFFSQTSAQPPGGDERRRVTRGEAVFQEQWCLRCHNLDLEGGAVAPSLDNVGARRDEDGLRMKLLDPLEQLTTSQMPSFAHLAEEMIGSLIAFLSTLTPERASPDNRGSARIEIPLGGDGAPRFSAGQVSRGKGLFERNGCGRCHTINGLAGEGTLGPNLTHESARKRGDAWQLEHLEEPVSVYTGGIMPDEKNWLMPGFGHLNRNDLKALVGFLQSLR